MDSNPLPFLGTSGWWPSALAGRSGQWLTHLMIRTVLTQTSHYYQFISLYFGNSKTRSAATLAHANNPSSNLVYNKVSAWRSLVIVHDRVIMFLYVALFVKYRFIALIAPGSLLDQFQYLDCLLVGRFKFIGRIVPCSGQLVTGFVFLFGLYRFVCIFMEPKFKFYALEFLANDFEDVELNCCEKTVQRRTAGNERKMRKAHGSDPSPRAPTSFKRESWQATNLVCYLENPFDPRQAEWILRPNRSPECWLKMSHFTQLLLAGVILGLIMWNVLIWYMIAGSVLTNVGFELSYSTCVHWLVTESRLNRSTPLQARIYQPAGKVTTDRDLDELPARFPVSSATMQQATAYNVIRTFADILENQLIYMEFGFAFSATFYLLAIQSIDIALNGVLIRAQLVRFLARLRNKPSQMASETSMSLSRAYQSSVSLWLPAHSSLGYLQRVLLEQSPSLTAELTQIQALLVDHARLTMAYNNYMSFYFVFQFALWLSYTLVVCIWMGSVKSAAVEMEFVIAEVGVTLLSVLLFSTAAMVRSINIQLYPLMLSIAARDPHRRATRPRWLVLVRYFYPKSMFCFRLLNSSEVSWLYCLKLISWILSAFVVLASFFYMKKRP